MRIKKVLKISLPWLAVALILPLATLLLYDVKPSHA